MTHEDMRFTWQYVDKWARIKPEAEAIVFEDKRLTWAALSDCVNRTAKALLELGVEHGHRVAMVSMARPEFLIAFLAANKIGAMWLGLSPKLTRNELQYIIEDCQPTILIVLKEYQGVDLESVCLPILAEVTAINHLLVINGRDDNAFDRVIAPLRSELDETLAHRLSILEPADDALLMYTSGSTGKPKGVVHTHESILASVTVQVERFDFNETSRTLLHFPINHVAADVEIGFASVYAGACVVMMDRFDPAATLRMVEQESITEFGQIPAMFLMEFASPAFKETNFATVRKFLWAGAGAPEVMLTVLNGIATKTGARLCTGYGSTEVCGFVTYSEPDDDLETLQRTAGKVAEPFELRIVDEQRNVLSTGEIGEIAVRGALLMDRYWNQPEATAQVIDDMGWYYTGDMAHQDERGCIHIVGRKSEMFKSGGENIYPREIEDVLEQHPAVLLAAVIGVPHPVYQEIGHAFVMPAPDAELTVDELLTHCKKQLASYKVPKAFELCSALPMLPTGKVDKQALRELLPG